MAAQTLNCPMCGAAASTDSTRCLHCGARLATVSCPSCFGMIFQGAKYCSHCGVLAARSESNSEAGLCCPRCKLSLKQVTLGSTQLQECPQCEGLWADLHTVERICADREQQVLVLGDPSLVPNVGDGQLETIRYLPCPLCHNFMNRVNFARCSAVVVDVCKGHGTWFDRDELRRIVAFIRSGGLQSARARELADLEHQRRRLAAERLAHAWSPASTPASNPEYAGLKTAISLLRAFLD